MKDTIFSKIIAGDIPCSKIYEDEATLAFLDINPISKGHTLVIPKTTPTNIEEASEEDLAAVFATVKKIAPSIVSGVGADAYNIGINNGSAAGQEVMHMHVHIIPRFSDDGLKTWPGSSMSTTDMEKIRSDIVAKL